MTKSLLPHPEITKIGNDRPAAVPSLWNKTYREIDANFAALSDFICTSNTRLRMYVGTPFALADNAFNKVSPSDAIMVGDIVAAPDGKLYKVSAVDERQFTLTDTGVSFKGIHELASDEEATAGAIDNKALTPKGAKAMIDQSLSETVKDATEEQKGIMAVASNAEVKAGTVTNKVVTPSGLKQFMDKGQLGNIKALGSSVDLNTVVNTGYYFVDGTGQTNGPHDDHLPIILKVYKSADNASDIVQEAIEISVPSDRSDDWRRFSRDSGSTWSEWRAISPATENDYGTVKLATGAMVTAGTDALTAVTPKALKDAGFITATETANLTRLGLTLIPSVPTVTKTEVTFPAMSRIRLADGTEHVLSVQTSVNMEVQASDRRGKDVYIWAGLDKVASGGLKLVTSLNAATFSELDEAVCVGGFHGLCKDVGSIENHALSGYVAGDILPRSIWTVNHRSICAPEGCVWIPEIGKWVQIYLPSWDGPKLVSKFGAVIADGNSEQKFNGSKFAEYAGLAGCELISYDEFTVVAKGSNEGTSIKDAKDPDTTGGHVDTADRRCVSNYGLEDCCGVLWQWTRTLFENVPTAKYTDTGLFYLQDYSWQENPVYNKTYDSAKMGSCYGLLRRAIVGASWVDSVHCGSRAVLCYDFSAFGGSSISSRLVSSSKPFPVLGKESNR